MLSSNVHVGLPDPNRCKETAVVEGEYKYYHYLCDGVNDVGWGCGYRTLQTICSWIRLSTDKEVSKNKAISEPSLREIQEILVELGDKADNFIGSREWIGTYEVFLVLDHLFDVSIKVVRKFEMHIPCKIIHVSHGNELYKHKDSLLQHFEITKSPIMMGGDIDSASKCIIGISSNNEERIHLLVVDPHYSGNTPSKDQLQNEGWVCWKSLESFDENSFYNFCLPQVKPSKV